MNEIDLKLNSLSVNRESYRASCGEEIRGFADCQNAGALKDLKKLCVMLGFGVTDEDNMARAHVFVLANPAHFQGSAVNEYAAGEFGQRGPKNKIPADADQNGRLG